MFVAADESSVNNRHCTLLAVDWDVTGDIRSVSMALCNIKAALLPYALDSKISSPKVAEVRGSQEQVEISKISGHLYLSCHIQVLQEPPHTEPHESLWATKKFDLELNGFTAIRSWKMISPIGETHIARYPRHELNAYDYFMWTSHHKQNCLRLLVFRLRDNCIATHDILPTFHWCSQHRN